MLRQSSTVVWHSEEVVSTDTNQFQYVVWTFGQYIRGIKNFRPVITSDGTHLYGKQKGAILVTIVVDAKWKLFPLAFAIVEGENNDSLIGS